MALTDPIVADDPPPLPPHRLPPSVVPVERDDYRFIEVANGFRIEHPQRHPVSVWVEPTAFAVANDEGMTERFHLLYPASEFVHYMAAMLLGPWGPEHVRLLAREASAIAGPVRAQRERLLARVDPLALGMQRTLVELFGLVPALVHIALLYRRPYIAGDVIRFRAAAIAFAYLESQLWKHFCRQQLGYVAAPSAELLAHAMEQWRGLFSPDGIPYRSLNRTLMNLPAETAPRLVCQLRRVRLERPIVNGLELTTVLVVASTPTPRDGAGRRAARLHIVQHARAEEIAAAVRQVGQATLRSLRPERLADLRYALDFIDDYPEPYAGRFGALAERAIRWHHTAPVREAQRWLAAVGGPQTPTARPPIPLPAIDGIRFLVTADEVVEEGLRMRHCIGTYARDAVRGRCFLFHVAHGGEHASIEVDARGRIRQVAGPHNSANGAVVWGRRQLRPWASALAAHHRAEVSAETNQLPLPFDA